MDRIESITAEQVMAVARKTFTSQNRTIAIGSAKEKRGGADGIPKPDPPSLKSDPPKRRPAAGRRASGVQGYRAQLLGPVRELILPNGLTILAIRRYVVPDVKIHAPVHT